MKVAATLLVGVLIGCLVIAGLGAFKNAVTAQAERWAAQHPPPNVTPARRALLSAGNFVTSYLIFASFIILPLSVGTAGFVAYRRERAAQQPARTNQSAFAEPSRRPFVVGVSTVLLEAAALSLPIGLLLLWLGRGSLRSPLNLPGIDLVSFVFPLFAFVGTLLALLSTLRRRRRQFFLELAFGVALLALSFLLPYLFRAG